MTEKCNCSVPPWVFLVMKSDRILGSNIQPFEEALNLNRYDRWVVLLEPIGYLARRTHVTDYPSYYVSFTGMILPGHGPN